MHKILHITVKNTVISQLKILQVDSEWFKHHPPTPTHAQTNELAVISSGEN